LMVKNRQVIQQAILISGQITSWPMVGESERIYTEVPAGINTIVAASARMLISDSLCGGCMVIVSTTSSTCLVN